MITAAQREHLHKYRVNPVLFFEEILGIKTLEEYQKRTLMEIAENDYLVISACHDVGKSFMAAGILLWFMSCFPYSKAVTTAPTWNQVKNILWAQLRSLYSKSRVHLGGRLNLTDWHLTPNGDWFAIGFSPRNEISGGEGQGTQSSFQGFHAESGDFLILFDEATGVRPGVWDMAEGMMTSGRAKFVGIANPTSRSSRFYSCFHNPTYKKVKLSCFDSPNLHANGIRTKDELKTEIDLCRTLSDRDLQLRLKSYNNPNAYLLSMKWVVKNILDWGWDHPLTLSKIFGEFPRGGSRDLITLDMVEEAQRNEVQPANTDRRTIGVDVARYGEDSSVITAQHGKRVKEKRALNKRDTGTVVGEVIDVYRTYGADVIVVDETGLGAGVLDGLRDAQRDKIIAHTVEIRGVQFGGKVECSAINPANCEHKDCDIAKYSNQKARMFTLLAKDLPLMTLPDEEVYQKELPAIRYSFDSKGRMVIESKDDYKKRMGGSPDHADSLALSNYGNYDAARIGAWESGRPVDEDDKDPDYYPPPLAASLYSEPQW